MSILCLFAVADPGFPVCGGTDPLGGTDLQHVHFSVKTYAKMKGLDPIGGCMLAAPPGSANDFDLHIVKIIC